jgi:hypothetical protein
MSRRLRWGLIGLSAFLAIAGLVLSGLYFAARYEPKFYRRAMQTDAAVSEKGSRQMLQRVSALIGDAQKIGRWEAVFTAEQINGWLAADFVRNHPDTLPPTMRDPRVEITPQKIVLACRYQRAAVSSVLTLTLDLYVPESSPSERNRVALRIVRARAGLLPLPLDDVLKTIHEAVQESGCHLEWRNTSGDPVALITLPPPHKNARTRLSIETIRLGEGEIYLAGTTQRQK